MKLTLSSARTGLVLAMIPAALAYCRAAEPTPDTTSTAPIAYIYIQVAKGVNVYSETAAGKLTLVKGSPFPTSGQMEGITGSHLLSVGTTVLHSYPIASNGTVGKQIASINTSTYDSEDCGPTTGRKAAQDHTGKYFYVELAGNCQNADASDWQSYQVSDGNLTFLYNSYPNTNDTATTAPVFDSTNQWAYAFAQVDLNGDTGFVPFMRAAHGQLSEHYGFTEQDPTPDLNKDYYLQPYAATADHADHLAVFMGAVTNCGGNCLPHGADAPNQLASYSIDPETGGIASGNTADNAPVVTTGSLLKISDDDAYLAAAGLGLQLFKWNGAGLPTALGGVLLPQTQIDQLAWDNANHLIALSYKAQKLYIFNVSKAKGVVEIGSPSTLPGAYGVTGVIVVDK